MAVVPSRSAETFGLAAAEAMAAGLPVAASRIGALPELVPGDWLAPAGDSQALAEVIGRLRGDREAGERAIARVREVAAPDVAARALRDGVRRGRRRRWQTPSAAGGRARQSVRRTTTSVSTSSANVHPRGI